VVAEGVERRRGHGVDRVRADEFFDVEHITIGGVLCARTRPEESLSLRALARQRAPALAAVEFLVTLIGQLGVSDGDFAEQALQPGPLLRVARRLQPGGQLGVNGGVDPADKETRHTGDAARVAAPRHQRLQAGDVRLGDGFIRRHAEQQGDVDVEAFADELPDRRDAGRRRRHFDQDVGA
jgi:hypothetical protein